MSMKATLEHTDGLRLCALGAAAVVGLGGIAWLASCTDPTGFKPTMATVSGADGGSAPTLQESFNEDCPADDSWIPAGGAPTPDVRLFEPAPHPDTECPFYRGVYQNFLKAAQPDAKGNPAFLSYPSIATAFTTMYPTGFAPNTGDLSGDPTKSPDPYVNPNGATGAAAVRKGAPTGYAGLGIIHQAGTRNVLVDQDHHTLYYGMQMNQVMADFIKANSLDTKAGIMAVKPDLELPPGVVLFKDAWKDIDPRDFPDANGKYGTPNGKVPPPTDFASDLPDYSNYITTMAWIPWLTQDPTTGLIEEDMDHPVLRKVALVAIHVVYSYPGHPELIWGSIQHVNIKEPDPAVQAFAGISVLGMPDSQPNSNGPDGGAQLPTPSQNNDVATPASTHRYLLYSAGTAEKDSMNPVDDKTLSFHEDTQTFDIVTNVYRMFPGSKANTLSPDTAVFSLNSNINTLFQNAISSNRIDPNVDKRQHYRLLAAVWMDKPAFFKVNQTLQNDDGTNPLVVDSQKSPPDVHPEVSQGVTCGTPIGPNGVSGDDPRATGFNNTVPGCDTRYDDLQLPDAGLAVSEPDGGPITPGPDFAAHVIGTDSPFSILGGEDRMSSTSMETFTQVGSFPNCFSCHNTQPISSKGVTDDCAVSGNCPAGEEQVIPFAAKINVTHFFSEYLLSEEAAAKRAAARAGN